LAINRFFRCESAPVLPADRRTGPPPPHERAAARAEAAEAELADLGDARLETPHCFFCVSLYTALQYRNGQ
jgi:hypothetical protein